MDQQFKYYAFISYKREDEKWANWLQRKIESFRPPARLCKSKPDIPRKLVAFKDTNDLKATTLKKELEDNLHQSKNLIVVCSRLSAQSQWVGEEVKHFLALGRDDFIFLFVIDGVPYSSNPDLECVHHVIKERLPEKIGANIHEAGTDFDWIKRERAFVRILAAMLDMGFDSLWQRRRRRFTRQLSLVSLLLVMILFTMVQIWRRSQPFEAKFSFQEVTPTNDHLHLPYYGGSVALDLDNQHLTDTLFEVHERISFPNIPSRFYNKPTKLHLSLDGYYTIDTILLLSEQNSIPIARDNEYYGKVIGIVFQDKDRKPLAGATVIIKGEKTITASDGVFEMVIPIPLQQESYDAIVMYQSVQSQSQEVVGWQNNPLLLNILYLK